MIHHVLAGLDGCLELGILLEPIAEGTGADTESLGYLSVDLALDGQQIAEFEVDIRIVLRGSGDSSPPAGMSRKAYTRGIEKCKSFPESIS